MTLSDGGTGVRRWTAGADGIAPRPWEDEWVDLPAGRLHAVNAWGLVEGRALCLAPVVLLDPRDWSWPDDGDEQWPLCWVCLALTSSAGDRHEDGA